MQRCSRLATSVACRLSSQVLAKTMTAIKPGFTCRRGRSAGACSGDGAQLVFLLPSEEATKDLAAVLCASRQPGDSYLIHGTLGAGKSAFWYAIGCRLSAAPGDAGDHRAVLHQSCACAGFTSCVYAVAPSFDSHPVTTRCQFLRQRTCC